MRSPAVCALTGISYRQLDYLTRVTPLTQQHPELNAGSGCKRNWPRTLIPRLMLAGLAIEAFPELQLPAVFEQLLDGPEPPMVGWLIRRYGLVSYVANTLDLIDALTPKGAAYILLFDLPALAATRGVDNLRAELRRAYVPA